MADMKTDKDLDYIDSVATVLKLVPLSEHNKAKLFQLALAVVAIGEAIALALT